MRMRGKTIRVEGASVEYKIFVQRDVGSKCRKVNSGDRKGIQP